jgi:hypothetical protein
MMQYPWLALTGESMFSSYEEATVAVMERVDISTWCFRPHTPLDEVNPFDESNGEC